MQKKAKDLKPGDVINTGTIVFVGSPETYCGSKNQVRIDIKYNGKETYSTRYWNADTTLKVKI